MSEMNEENRTHIAVTEEEKEEFEAYRAAKAKAAAEAKKKEDRDAYAVLVDETIDKALPELVAISSSIGETKKKVMETFQKAIDLKGNLFGIKETQRSHTFTNSDATKRITIGRYCNDGYKDTVNEGIAMIKEYLESLAKDEESRTLVTVILQLLSKDNAGNLKAAKVLQLRKMADESSDERFVEGVRIINESYQPVASKQFIRAETRGANGEWVNVPLGMTEA